jgi:C-terminal processing protease CtpA/Prc
VNNRVNRRISCIFALVCVVAFWSTTQGTDEYDISIFNQAFDLLEKNYINPLEIDIPKFRTKSEKEFLSTCSGGCLPNEAERKIDKILLKTNDPHLRLVASVLLKDDPGDVVGSQSHSQHYGLRLLEQNNHIVVTRVQPDSWAAKFGISVGDEIVSFENLTDKHEIFQTLANREFHNEPVVVGIHRLSGQTKPVRLIPSEFRWISYLKKIDADTSIIYAPNIFPTGTVDVEIHNLIKKALGNGSKKLILDLRFNEGGGPFGSINILGSFIKRADQVYTNINHQVIKYAYEDGKTYYENSDEPEKVNVETFENASKWNYPVAILVGPNTVSVSETLAATFQKYKRGIIIGESTWGGGGVLRNAFPLKTGAQMIITTHRISNADGTLLPLKVTPDINLPLDLVGLTKGHDNQIEAAVNYLDNQK